MMTFKKGTTPWNKGEKLSPLSKETREKISKANKGKKHGALSATHRENLSKSLKKLNRTREKSPRWLGDDVGYGGIHHWIKRQLGKARQCVNCHTKVTKSYAWANISGEYKRDIADWHELCHKCNKNDGVKIPAKFIESVRKHAQKCAPPLLRKAKRFATIKHAGQVRTDGSPYINHPRRVAKLIKLVAPDDLQLQAVGWLHDTLEDTSTTYEELVKRFGKEIADLTLELTKVKLNNNTAAYFPHLKSHRAILAKFCDRLDNLSDMKSWSPEKTQGYLNTSKFWRSTISDDIHNRFIKP